MNVKRFNEDVEHSNLVKEASMKSVFKNSLSKAKVESLAKSASKQNNIVLSKMKEKRTDLNSSALTRSQLNHKLGKINPGERYGDESVSAERVSAILRFSQKGGSLE